MPSSIHTVIHSPLPRLLWDSSVYDRAYAFSVMLMLNPNLDYAQLLRFQFSVSLRFGYPIPDDQHELHIFGKHATDIQNLVPAFLCSSLDSRRPFDSALTWYESLPCSPGVSVSDSPPPSATPPRSLSRQSSVPDTSEPVYCASSSCDASRSASASTSPSHSLAPSPLPSRSPSPSPPSSLPTEFSERPFILVQSRQRRRSAVKKFARQSESTRASAPADMPVVSSSPSLPSVTNLVAVPAVQSAISPRLPVYSCTPTPGQPPPPPTHRDLIQYSLYLHELISWIRPYSLTKLTSFERIEMCLARAALIGATPQPFPFQLGPA